MNTLDPLNTLFRTFKISYILECTPYYHNKTKDMSWDAGYEFILRCLVEVVWKSFLTSFFAIPLCGIGQGLRDAIRSTFNIFLGVY